MPHNHYDDNRPFFRMAKDVADKVEEKRRGMVEGRRKRGIGTLSGLEAIVAKRKREESDAKRTGY